MADPETEATRDLIRRFLEARNAYDHDRLVPLLAEEVELIPPASVPIAPVRGREAVAERLAGPGAGGRMDRSTVERQVHKLVADGDTAVLQQRMRYRTVDGKEYDNEYCWVYTCRDGEVTRMVEYADSLYAARFFGWIDG